MFLQHPMDEDVTAANLFQKTALTGVVEEAGIVPGNVIVAVKEETQGKMFNTICSTTKA